MVVKVLGPLETGTDPLSPRERTVLSALIVRAGSTVAPAELAEAWWGEAPPRTWEQQVRNSIARIRARLGHGSIETLGWEYRLALDVDSIDAFRFERLVSAARGHVLHGEHDRAIDAYGRALALWRGAPLQDLTRWEPGVVEAMRLGEIRASAEEELLDARLAVGEHRSLIPDAERLLREQPLREDRWAIVALANYRANRQAEALAVVRAARDRLADELGIEPGPRLAALELAMLRQDPSLDAPVPAARIVSTCPYPGLRPFGPDDSDVFFGRDDDIEALLQRLEPGGIVTIAGASGTGKSSLLLAGLIPRLRARGTSIEIVRPSVGSVAALQRAAERAQVVAIDQAEELAGDDDIEVAAFAHAARAFLDGGHHILMTARSDALDRLRALPEVGDQIGRGIYLLGGLSEAAYRSAIEEPARRGGLVIEPGLVEIAVRDAGDRASTLPHLSHALQETWTKREGATLTVDGYQRSGGIAGAIAQSAEEAFRGLTPEEQSTCRSLLLRLIERGADGASTRRRVSAEPLLADSARRRVLERLVRARLVTLDGDAVVVAHEAVATAWPRLDAWLEEDAEGARTLRSIESGAAVWAAGGRDENDLLRGARLHSALTWQDTADPDLTPVEREFLSASDAREQGELREVNERAGREKRRNRVLRAALAGAGVLLVAAVVAGSLAAVRGQEAAEAAENAEIEALVATSLALRQNDRDAAALLAAEAHRRWPDDGRVRSALLGSITAAGGLLDMHRTEGADYTTMTMIPGTETALRVRDGSAGTALEIVEVASGEVVRTLAVDLDVTNRWLLDYRDVAVSGDGRIAAVQTGVSVDPDSAVCCWNQLTFIHLESGLELPGSQLLKMRTSTSIELGTDGTVAYFVHPLTADLIAVDTQTGELRTSGQEAFDDFSGQGGLYNGVAVLDDDLVAVGAEDRIDVFQRSTLALERSIALSARFADSDLLPDGVGGLYASGGDGIAYVVPETGRVEWERRATRSDVCYFLARTADGTLLCSGLDRVSVLDPATGLPDGRSLQTQLDSATTISVIDDRTVLIDARYDTGWMRWRLDGSGASVELIARGHSIVAEPSPDGRLIAVTTDGESGGLWDLASDKATDIHYTGLTQLTEEVIEYYIEGEGGGLENITTGERWPYDIPGLENDFGMWSGGWGPHAFVHFEGRLIAFDPETGGAVGEPIFVPDSDFQYLYSVSESADGANVLVTWLDSEIGYPQSALFRIADGALLARGLPDRERTLITSSGAIVAVGSESVERVDPTTFEPRSTLAQADGGSQLLMASLDERTMLSVGYDNRVRLYDLTLDIPLGDAIEADTEQGWPGGYLTPDGQTLLTNAPGGILSWDLRTDAQAGAACALAGRDFSAAEWNTYFPDDPQVLTCAELAG